MTLSLPPTSVIPETLEALGMLPADHLIQFILSFDRRKRGPGRGHHLPEVTHRVCRVKPYLELRSPNTWLLQFSEIFLHVLNHGPEVKARDEEFEHLPAACLTLAELLCTLFLPGWIPEVLC